PHAAALDLEGEDARLARARAGRVEELRLGGPPLRLPDRDALAGEIVDEHLGDGAAEGLGLGDLHDLAADLADVLGREGRPGRRALRQGPGELAGGVAVRAAARVVDLDARARGELEGALEVADDGPAERLVGGGPAAL